MTHPSIGNYWVFISPRVPAAEHTRLTSAVASGVQSGPIFVETVTPVPPACVANPNEDAIAVRTYEATAALADKRFGVMVP